jgi:hypothetical protein
MQGRTAESEILRMFKKVFWQGRSERRGEAYCFCTSSLGAKRERSQKPFSTSDRKGATGFDGDTEVSGACRALGVS